MPVKGTKIEQLNVVAVDNTQLQKKRFMQMAIYVASLFAIMLASHFYWGWFEQDLRLENSQLKERLEFVETELSQKADALLVSEHGTDVTEQAEERLRQDIITLEEQLSELQQEVAFYKAIMSPSELKEGLRVERLELEPTVDAHRIAYKLLLTQLSNHRRAIAGVMSVKLVGSNAGQVVEHELSTLDTNIKSPRIGFRFRYYQNFTGEIALPEGFVPEKMLVTLKPKGQGNKVVNKEFAWQLVAAGLAQAQ